MKRPALVMLMCAAPACLSASITAEQGPLRERIGKPGDVASRSGTTACCANMWEFFRRH